jgi:raffinose/stachyose/melibiose transport system permease protein
MGMTVKASTRQLLRWPRHSSDLREATLLLTPVVLVYSIFAVAPILYAIWLSFQRWDGIAAVQQFIGLQNYEDLAGDPVFWSAFENTLIWAALSIGGSLTLGLGLAVALDRPLFGRTVLRAILYFPAILSTVVVSMVWIWMDDPNFGVVNAALQALGLGGLAQAWLGDPSLALYAVFVASVWQGTGVSMVLFLAGLQNVPNDLREAADIDGAGAVQKFRYITLPSLRPTTVLVVSLTIINSLKAFDLVFAMTGGGPAQSSHLLATLAYQTAFQHQHYGKGAAVGVILLILSLAMIIPFLRWSHRDS